MRRIATHNKITLLNLASTVILQGLAFFTAPLFSNLLGTSNYGIAAVYLTWVQVANTIFTLQSGSIAQARIYFPEEEQAAYQSSVLSLGTFSYLSFSALTLLAVRFLPINVPFPMALLALLQGWGLYCVSFANGKFTYEFKAEENFVLSLLIAFSNVILSLFLIGRFPAEENYWGRILGQSVSYTLIGSVVFISILIRGKTLYCSRYWRFTLPISIPVIFHLLAHILLNQCDRIMLNSMLNSSVVGIYSLAVTFSTVINTLYSAFNNSWVPFYYEYTKRHEIFNVRKHARNYNGLYFAVQRGIPRFRGRTILGRSGLYSPAGTRLLFRIPVQFSCQLRILSQGDSEHCRRHTVGGRVQRNFELYPDFKNWTDRRCDRDSGFPWTAISVSLLFRETDEI